MTVYHVIGAPATGSAPTENRDRKGRTMSDDTVSRALSCGCVIEVNSERTDIAAMCEPHFAATEHIMRNPERQVAAWRILDLRLTSDSWPQIGTYSPTVVLNARSAALQDYITTPIEQLDNMRHAIRRRLIEGITDPEQCAIWCERLNMYALVDTPDFRRALEETTDALRKRNNYRTDDTARWAASMNLAHLMNSVEYKSISGPAYELQTARARLVAYSQDYVRRFKADPPGIRLA